MTKILINCEQATCTDACDIKIRPCGKQVVINYLCGLGCLGNKTFSAFCDDLKHHLNDSYPVAELDVSLCCTLEENAIGLTHQETFALDALRDKARLKYLKESLLPSILWQAHREGLTLPIGVEDNILSIEWFLQYVMVFQPHYLKNAIEHELEENHQMPAVTFNGEDYWYMHQLVGALLRVLEKLKRLTLTDVSNYFRNMLAMRAEEERSSGLKVVQ